MCLSRQLTSLLPCPHPDTGYQEPPQGPQKLLLSCFVGILAILSILATALLLWKKVGDVVPQQPTPGFLPGESHRQRSLAGHSP